MHAALRHSRTILPALAGFVVLALLAGAATVGWVRHGEAIFLKLANGAWINCF